jgi:hypothetical protein
MAITSRDLHLPPSDESASGVKSWLHREPLAPSIRHGSWIVLAALCLSLLAARGQIWLDDLRYGRPRTVQVGGLVGHNEGTGEPTHFIAMNLNRHVVVIELPGGDVGRAQTLQGPYLFGANEDLTPVGLRLHDVDGDGKADLILSVKREEIIYINTGSSFRLITADERRRIQRAH